MPDDLREGGFGLYLHWPFCEAKCPYCDFNSHVAAVVDHDRWTRAFQTEIARWSAVTGPRQLRSIFFGGGTPSLMRPETVDAIITAARAAWSFENAVEITLEANPTSIEATRFEAYRTAGVNRISIGVQSLDDAHLKRLGRLHSAQEAVAAVELAKSIFERVSFDLIYARQDQSIAEWERELDRALYLAADHLSLYQLTIESGTAFGARHAIGRLPGLPDDDLSADLWDVTQKLTLEAGLRAYETSNHARDGAESRHNLIYWTGGDYVGVGPGAHGRLTRSGHRVASESPAMPAHWLQSAEERREVEPEMERMSRTEHRDEMVMMGLRLVDGVALSRLPLPLAPERLASLQEDGWLEVANDRLRLTPAGRPLLNEILRQILA